MQPERDAVPQARSLALPGEAIIRGAEAALRAGPDSFHDRRLRRADPQVQAGDPAVERRAVDLVDQRPPALVLVLDREHASVGQDADRQAGPVGDAAQAESSSRGVSKVRRGVIRCLRLRASGGRPIELSG